MRYALVLCGIALHAQTTLEPAKPVEDYLKSGETRSYQVAAKTGDFVRGKADAPGLYRLDIKPAQTGKVHITIHQIQPLIDRLNAPSSDGDRSPRIMAL